MGLLIPPDEGDDEDEEEVRFIFILIIISLSFMSKDSQGISLIT